MSHYAGPTFVEVGASGKLVLYVTGRDALNRSRIGRVHAVIKEQEIVVERVDESPVFDIGGIGQFDESGVSYPWICDVGDRKFMYYVGWVAGGLARFQNFTGLAISEDGGETYHRYKKVPILDRTEDEPFGSGSCAVYPRDGKFEMLYTAFEPWGLRHGKLQPSYNIKYAYSDDGLDWHREGDAAINFKDETEYVIGKPMPLLEGGVHKLWYSYRGEAYRIGYAESLNGHNYLRKDEEAGIEVSESGWDSEMIEYAFVFRSGTDLFMIYNGNQFGKTGLGWAIQE
jgi:predicted GH43/DUF377 family glycosyl hydrolase